MARARNIKPGFYKNEDLAECSVWARFIFPGLWMLADREGRLEDRPKRIKGELLPFDSVEVEPLLQELQARGFIVRYTVKGLGIIQISNFCKHQNPHHREPPSDLPPHESPRLDPVGNTSKPEALPSCNDPKARGQPEASPRLDPPESDLARGSSRADSLIPDSGFLNPDPLIRCQPSAPPTSDPAPAGLGDSVAGRDRPPENPEPAADPPPDTTRYGVLSAELRRRGVRCTGSHPDLVALVDDGFALPEIVEALAVAAMADSAPKPMNVGYLAKVVRSERERAKRPARNREPAWWTSEAATEAKAREVGCWPARPTESWDQLRNRIRERLAQREQEAAA
ncbi:MAG: hypothetical protein BroJett024_41410 [Alphaproteobacteria bacterium]|nr:MAG: hypothetical protein BroJett024_41410 [Alphaproteobacteria bacterium]